jgi:hypothetical protein
LPTVAKPGEPRISTTVSSARISSIG